MNRKDLIDRLQELYKDEDSRVTVNPHAGQKIAIVYPNTYFVGMSNLGLHIIYEEINLRNDSVCERIFLPEKKELEAYDKTKTPLMSVETGDENFTTYKEHMNIINALKEKDLEKARKFLVENWKSTIHTINKLSKDLEFENIEDQIK